MNSITTNLFYGDFMKSIIKKLSLLVPVKECKVVQNDCNNTRNKNSIFNVSQLIPRVRINLALLTDVLSSCIAGLVGKLSQSANHVLYSRMLRISALIAVAFVWSLFLAISSIGFAQTLPTLNIYATGTTNQSATIKEGESISVDIKRSATATTALDVTIKIEETTTASSTNILENSLETTSETVTILANMTTYTHSLDSLQDTTSTNNGEVVITLLATTPTTYTLPTPAANQKVTFTVNHTTLPKISISSTATEFVEGATFPLKIEVTSGTVPSGGLTIFLNSIPSGIDNHVLLLGPRHSDSYSIPDDQTEKEFTVHTNARPGFFPRGFIEIVPHIAPQGTTTGYVFSSTNKIKIFVQDANVPTLNIKTNQATGIEGATIEMEIELNPAPLVNIPVTLSHNSSAYFDSFSPVSDPTNMPNVVSIPRNSTSFTVEIVTTSDNTETTDGTITVTIAENRTYYKVDTADDDFTISVMNFSSFTNISIDKSSTLTSINEGENFEITLTVSAIQTIDLPVTLTTSDNDLGYLERFDPNPIVIPANSESLTVTVHTKRLPANDADTTFRISVGQDIANSNPNLRYVAAEGNSGYVEVEIINIVNPTVQITSTANESSVVESTAFTFTLMATPAPTTNEVLTVTLTLDPSSTPYLDANFKLTYEVDSTGMLDVTVPTNLQAPNVASETIKIEIVANPELYLIRDDYHKIEFGIIKVAETTKSIISITSDSDGESISEGQGFSFRLAAFEPPASDLEVHLTISDDSGFIESDLTMPQRITTSGTLDVDVMTQADVDSEEGGEIKISIAEHLNYFISGRENQISITVLNISTVISISTGDGPHPEGSTILFTITSSEPPANPATINIEVSEMDGDDILASSPRTFQVELTSAKTTETVSIRTQKNGVHMHGGSLTATATTTSTDVILAQGEISISVVDSDTPPSISISTEATSVTEGGTGAGITLTANNTVSNIELPITLEIDDGDHNFFTNANPDPVVVNLPARMESVTHTITPQDDTVAERSGNFTVEVTSETTNTNYTVADSPNHIISLQFIDDDIDDLPQLSVSAVEAEVTEAGDENNVVNASFKIAVDPITTTSLTVRYEVFVLGNYLQDQDNYNEILSPTITFNNGEYMVDLPILNDNVTESRGNITLTIYYERENLTYRIDADNDSAEISVLDDDGGEDLPKINISAEDSVVEGEEIIFTLTADPSATLPSSELTIILNITQIGNYLTNDTGERSVMLPITGATTHVEPTSWLDESIRNGMVMAEIESESDPMTADTYSIGTEFRVAVEVEVYRGPIVSVTPPNAPITAGTPAIFNISTSIPSVTSDLNVLIQVTQLRDIIQWRVPNAIIIPMGDSSFVLQIPTRNIVFTGDNDAITVAIHASESSDYRVRADTEATVMVTTSETDVSTLERISVAGAAVTAILNYNPSTTEEVESASYGESSQPIVSIQALNPVVLEGQSAQFLIGMQVTSANDLDINININGGQSYVNISAPSQQVQISRGQSRTLYTLATIDDERAEDDETIVVSITEGEGYSIADSPLNQASALISDVNDRTEYNERLSAANRILIPELMATTGIQSHQTMSNRVHMAFNNEEKFLFEVAGQSNPTNILSLTGQTLNQQDDLMDLLRDDTHIAIGLTTDNAILNNTTAWLKSENHNVYNLNRSDSANWSGDFYTGNFGIDTRLNSGLLLGIATSISERDINFTMNQNQEFQYTARYTGFNPYLALHAPALNTQVWVSSNVSSGYIDVDSEHQLTHRLDSRFSTLTFGGTSQLYSNTNSILDGISELNLTGQGWLAQQNIEGDGLFTSDLTTEGHHLQVSLAGSHELDFTGFSTFEPTVVIGMRQAKKDVDSVTGLEIELGTRYANNSGLTLEGFGRGFKGSEQQDYAVNISGELTYHPNHDNTGSQLTISPSWGQSSDSTQLSLWQNNLTVDNDLDYHYSNGPKLKTELAYDIDILDDSGKFIPFSAIDYSGNNLISYDVGNRITIGTHSNFEIIGTHEVRDHNLINNRVHLQGTIRW